MKRNAGGGGDAAVGARTAASPRARSPIRGNVKVLNESQNQNQQQSMSLSRSNFRKAEHSPYRRNPSSEIDTNVVAENMSLPGSKSPNSIITQVCMLRALFGGMKHFFCLIASILLVKPTYYCFSLYHCCLSLVIHEKNNVGYINDFIHISLSCLQYPNWTALYLQCCVD